MVFSQKIKEAYKESLLVRLNSHSPYSQFKVGAALVLEDGDIVRGCNVENVSFGATVCAERIAIFRAITEGKREFSFMVISTDLVVPAPPCAICLQVMSEFCKPDFKIYLANLSEISKEYTLSDLLPLAFKEF